MWTEVVRHHLPPTAVQLADLTSAWCSGRRVGARARHLVQSVTVDDVSHAGFPFAHLPGDHPGPIRSLASRISYVASWAGSCTRPWRRAKRLWTSVDAGPTARASSRGRHRALNGTTGRLEKGFRAYGNELEQEYTWSRRGWPGRRSSPRRSFGKEAYLRQRAEPPVAVLCTLTVDSHVATVRGPPLHAGAGADRDAGRRAARRPEGPAVLRHQRRCGPSVGQVPPEWGTSRRTRRRSARAWPFE